LSGIDPIYTPENQRVGLSLHLNFPFAKIRDKKLLISLYNPQTKKVELVDAIVAASKVIGFPDEYDKKFVPLRKEVMVTRME